MFTRRHPILFFILMLTGLFLMAILCFTFIVAMSFSTRDIGFGEKVGIVEIVGVISDSDSVLRDLKRFREDENIKAIVVRINSPGGVVGPSQEIYREIHKTRKKKPIIASLGSIAASGGYYIAAAADTIITNPGTITGSIGVIMGFTNYAALFEKIGLRPMVVKSGKFKDIGSPTRKMSKEERDFLQAFAQKIHQQFIRDVVSGRKMDFKKVESLSDGRIFTGEESVNLGLVDRLGNLEDAILWAGRKGGITGKVTAVYARKKDPGLFDSLIKSMFENIGQTIYSKVPSAEFIYRPSF